MSDDVVDSDIESALQDANSMAVDELSEVERERNEYLETLQRLQAEFENYRKRVAKSSEDAAVRAAGSLVATLLPVIDAYDLAQAHFEESTSD